MPEALVSLGELRRRQGRFPEAADCFTRAEAQPGAVLGRGALDLDLGQAEAALDVVGRYLRRLPEGDRILHAPGWALQARAHAALGRPESAAAALAALREVATAADTEAVRAQLRLAEGEVAVAAGELEAARCAFEDALELYERTGAPFEAGRARTGLAQTLLALCRRAAGLDEARAAQAQLERLGAGHEAARAAALVAAATGETTAAADGDGADGLTPRQRDVLRLVAQGLSNRDIGERLHLSEFTVKRHVADILTKLDLPSRAAAATYAAQHGLV